MNSLFLTDGYKTGHHQQYPEGTTLVFSGFTPRSDAHAPKECQGNGVVSISQMAMQWVKEHFDKNFFFTEERKLIPSETGIGFVDTLNKGTLQNLKYNAIQPIKEELSMYLNTDYDTSHFESLWDLGYLPLEIRALEDGTICPIKVPMLTIHNTIPEFYWLPNFLETILSQLLWKSMTSATIAHAYRKVLTKWAKKTNPDGIEFVNWQGHDFSMRGLDSLDATVFSGIGHLTSFFGTDSLPTLRGARYYYDEPGFIGGSVVATEHSVMCAGSKEGEKETFLRLLKTYPTGILSVVSDTWDLWNVLTNILPSIKKEILARDGKLVIRPDSGDPVNILCGIEIEEIKAESYEQFLEFAQEELHERLSEETPHGEYGGDISDYFKYRGKVYDVTYAPEWNRYDKQYYFIDSYYSDNATTAKEVEYTPAMKGVVELLWETFGGTTNAQGYKILDSHIGAIYGDSITLQRADEILSRLEKKGFASTNVVLGIGSFTYQYNTRDTFGFAMKATYVEKEEVYYATTKSVEPQLRTVGYEIFKDPITDNGVKKSAKGLMRVLKKVNDDATETLILQDGCTWEEVQDKANQLQVVFLNGELKNRTTLTAIRQKLC